MPIKYQSYITRQDLRDHPEWLAVFGDNFEKEGLGGQAKEMRGEPNAIGIPTKRSPKSSEKSFLTNEDYAEWWERTEKSVLKLMAHIEDGGTVVWPLAGIGTGLANLESRAPVIWWGIQRINNMLEGNSDEEDTIQHIRYLETYKWNGF